VTEVADPFVPLPYRVGRVRRETSDISTLELAPVTGERPDYQPGQFNMLYAFGIGEVAISMSGNPASGGSYVHTVRDVGVVSGAIAKLGVGATLGVRGPYGTPWPVESAEGSDVVFVAGGLGLAPLRPAIYHVLARREHYGRVVILYGTRSPSDILFRNEVERWRRRLDLEVLVTVDRADAAWRGDVGVVPRLIARAGFDPHSAVAMVCGPEVMMRFTANPAGSGRRTGADLSVDGAQHEMCHRPVRSLPVRTRLRLQGRPGHALRPYRRYHDRAGDLRWPNLGSRGWRFGSSPPATAVSFRCWIVRTNYLRWPARWRSRISRKPPV
jgi:NAD(P)H-flavin reductase